MEGEGVRHVVTADTGDSVAVLVVLALLWLEPGCSVWIMVSCTPGFDGAPVFADEAEGCASWVFRKRKVSLYPGQGLP
jgi:hypothetical protein